MGYSAGNYTPPQYRWMLFVDGENLAIRAKDLAQQDGVTLVKGPFYEPDVFAWIPSVPDATSWKYATFPDNPTPPHAIRAHYYTTVRGANEKLQEIEAALRGLAFEPKVFKKEGKKSKGVDVTLTKDILSHAFLNNYDLVVLIAGDADYLPLVEEVKRLGKIVYVSFLSSGLSPELRLAADRFWSLDKLFLDGWRSYKG